MALFPDVLFIYCVMGRFANPFMCFFSTSSMSFGFYSLYSTMTYLKSNLSLNYLWLTWSLVYIRNKLSLICFIIIVIPFCNFTSFFEEEA